MKRAAFLLLLVPSLAWGQSSYRFSDSVGGAWLTAPSEIEVDREDIAIACREEGEKVRCTYEITYLVRNATTNTIVTEGAFYGDGNADIALDGKSARDLQVNLAPLDALVRSLADKDDRWDPGYRTPFSISMAPNSSSALKMNGKLSATYGERGYDESFVFPAYMARHPLMHTRLAPDRRFEFQYRVFPLRAFRGARKVHVDITWPRSWDYAPPTLDGAAPFSVERGHATVDADGSQAGTISLAFRRNGSAIANGGPFIGVGGQPEPGEARLRAGWEIAGPESAISWSLAAETNARDRFLVALIAEASTPNIMALFPGLGIGAGPVVGGGPRGPYGGARIQPILTWPFLSFVVPIDIVAPSFTGGGSPLVTIGFLGQISL